MHQNIKGAEPILWGREFGSSKNFIFEMQQRKIVDIKNEKRNQKKLKLTENQYKLT